VLLKGEINGY